MTRYETLLDLFLHDGWKIIVEEAQETLDVINTIDNVADEKDLYFKQGEMAILRQIINREYTEKMYYEMGETDA